ncbi:uncharacterized protein ARMOST_01332 [Armillaria ostoyae]|uniref:Uncharacterized protein n=1 Tax=Armillaria ostoyae TaxID=47428 RepID=A0A284QNM9_ARMOS|nr:uncharacterized protein ARMOST_01332 [Armillaria ostoyae]
MLVCRKIACKAAIEIEAKLPPRTDSRDHPAATSFRRGRRCFHQLAGDLWTDIYSGNCSSYSKPFRSKCGRLVMADITTAGQKAVAEKMVKSICLGWKHDIQRSG